MRGNRVAVPTQALQDPVVDRGSPAVAAVISALPSPFDDRPALICIDGLGGAGKSTLAEAVASERPGVTVVHGDDFYGPPASDWTTWTPQQGYERYFEHERLEDQPSRPAPTPHVCPRGERRRLDQSLGCGGGLLRSVERPSDFGDLIVQDTEP